MTRTFGLDRLDLKVAAHLPDSGVFVEAGAHDGLTQSNTATLELFRSWRGLLVEPIPELARRCRANRPGAIVEHVRPYSLLVPARTLSSLLDEHGIERVDFLSLDLEGYEANALRGVDFERHRPVFILVEVSREPGAIEQALSPWYVQVAELSDHRGYDPPWYDVLYRAR